MPLTEEQQEEISSLCAIFEGCTPTVDGVEVDAPFGETGNITLTLKIGSDPLPQIALSGLPRVQTDALLTHLSFISRAAAGTPHLFELVQALRAWLGIDDVPDAIELMLTQPPTKDAVHGDSACASSKESLDEEKLLLVHGDSSCGVVIDRKSVFQAHVGRVESREDVDRVLASLYREPKLARATHNIQAWRFWHESRGEWAVEGDDDGEDGAARKLQLMMNSMDVRNGMVVVSRWFGGTLLGPARFHHINTVAKALLEREGYGAVAGHAAGAGRGGKGQGHGTPVKRISTVQPQ